MDFQKSKLVEYNQVEKCVEFLKCINVHIDDVQLFDQIQNLKNFLCSQNDSYFSEKTPKKLTLFFLSNTSMAAYSEILKIAQFFFAIPGHNANTERIFSLISSQWTKERNRFLLDNVKGMMMVQFNFKHFKCADFYKFLKEEKNIKLLKQISNTDKYTNKQ